MIQIPRGNKPSHELSGSSHSNSLDGAGFSSRYDSEKGLRQLLGHGRNAGHPATPAQIRTRAANKLVIRDWKTELDDGTGGREYKNGNCYDIYLKLYEGGQMEILDTGDLL